MRFSKSDRLLVVFCSRFEYVRGHSLLPESLYQPLLVNRILLLGSGYQPSEIVIVVIMFLTLVFGLFALVGWKTNITVALFALGNIFTIGFKYSFREFHHGETVMAIALVMLALAPSGKSLSLDAIMFARRRGLSDLFGLQKRSGYSAWPLILVQILLGIVYFDSGMQKLYHSGLEWVKGTTLEYYLIHHGVGRGSDLALYIVKQDWLLPIASAMTILFELTFWLVILKPRLAWIYVPVGLSFHIANLVLKIAPFYEFMALYIVFLPQLLGFWRDSPLTFLNQAVDLKPRYKVYPLTPASTHGIVLFDGECNFCNAWVQFVFANDPQGKFHFAPLQSEVGKSLLTRHGLDPAALDSIVLVVGDTASTKSSAAINILRKLGIPWSMMVVFLIIPKFMRNWVYDWIARNRYRWFGKNESCALPSREMSRRFVSRANLKIYN